MGLREEILAKNDRRVEPVDVPEWDQTVYVRSLSGTERAKLMQFVKKEDVLTMAMSPIHLVVMSCCDEHGNRLFTDEDFDALADHDANALDRIASAATKLNGLHSDEAVEEAKKNS